MRLTNDKDSRILAIDPTTRGFGFAVLEGPDQLVDWGVKSLKKKSCQEHFEKVQKLIECYSPTTIVFMHPNNSRRCPRIKDLLNALADLRGDTPRLRCRMVPRATIFKIFRRLGAKTKHDIALKLALYFPELQQCMPKYRKPWMSEDYRMNIFDAVCLAFACFFQI
jgi:hypothetical protein